MKDERIEIIRTGSKTEIRCEVRSEGEAFDLLAEALYQMAASFMDHDCNGSQCTLRSDAKEVHDFFDKIKERNEHGK